MHFTSGVKPSTEELEVLLFVDDMVLLADSAEWLDSSLKARVMRVVRQKGHCKMRIGDMEIEQVKLSGCDDQQRWDYGEGS